MTARKAMILNAYALGYALLFGGTFFMVLPFFSAAYFDKIHNANVLGPFTGLFMMFGPALLGFCIGTPIIGWAVNEEWKA